jgi:ribonuclease D
MVLGVKKKMEDIGGLDYQMITDTADLEKLTPHLSRQKNLAVDLEADSMYHYKEKVCLIQVATPQKTVLIDPIEIEDMSSIKPVFENPGIRKIFHGSDYDVRSMYRDFHIDISNLFDTELAVRFLGIQETGLEAVLGDRFNIRLDKKYQKKDWSRRPLPKAMVDYAASDVRFLIPLAEMLQEELQRKGRREWVEEECERLSNVRPTDNHQGPLFLRFKGAGRLPPRNLAVLEVLLQLRDRIAEKKDRPLYKILQNDLLLKMARMDGADMKSIAARKILSRKQLDMYGTAVEESLRAAWRLPEDKLPRYPRKPTKTYPVKIRNRIKLLKDWRDRKGIRLELDPSIVCTKLQITGIAVNQPKTLDQLADVPGIRNWQVKAFGSEILDLTHQ